MSLAQDLECLHVRSESRKMRMIMILMTLIMMTSSLMSLAQECPHVKRERERAGKIEGHVQSQLGVGVMSSLRKMQKERWFE